MNALTLRQKSEALAALKITRQAGQIKNPSVLYRVLGWVAWIALAALVTAWFVHPLTTGWMALALDGALLTTVWFVQAPLPYRDLKAGLDTLWRDPLTKVPENTVAFVRSELVKQPSLLTKAPRPSRFVLLDEPEPSVVQTWLVVGWNNVFDRHVLEEEIVLADSREEIQAWASEAKREPLLVINELELAVAEVVWGDRWHWANATRKKVSAWRGELNRVRTGAGDGAHQDLRQHENAKEREDLLRYEQVGQQAYWKAHPELSPINGPGMPWEEFIPMVRQLGKAKWEKDLARLDGIVARARVLRAAKGEVSEHQAPVAPAEEPAPTSEDDINAQLAGSTP